MDTPICNIPFAFENNAMNNAHMISSPIDSDDTYVHFGKPAFIGSDDYSAWSGRGDAIRVPMETESGVRWEMVIGFHKGNTYIYNTNVVEKSK